MPTTTMTRHDDDDDDDSAGAGGDESVNHGQWRRQRKEKRSLCNDDDSGKSGNARAERRKGARSDERGTPRAMLISTTMTTQAAGAMKMSMMDHGGGSGKYEGMMMAMATLVL